MPRVQITLQDGSKKTLQFANDYTEADIDEAASYYNSRLPKNTSFPVVEKPKQEKPVYNTNNTLKGGVSAYNPLYKDILTNNSLTKEQKAQAIIQRGEAERKQIDAQRNKELKNIWGKGAIGATLESASFHPILNVPYVGTGIGGALFGAGDAITKGKKAKDIIKEAGQGFVIGETVGAIPYVGKGIIKTKAGQTAINKAGDIGASIAKSKVGQAVGNINTNIANSQLGQATGKAIQKVGDELVKERHIIKPQNIYNDFTANNAQKEIQKEIADLMIPETKSTTVTMAKQGKFWRKNIDDPFTRDLNNADVELNSIIKEISKNPDIINDAKALDNFEQRLAQKVNFPDKEITNSYYSKYYDALDKAQKYENVSKDLELSNAMRAQGELRQSQLAQRADLPDEIKKGIKQNPPEYQVLHNDEIQNEAINIVENNPEIATQLRNKAGNEKEELTALDFETARQTLDKLYKEGRIEEAIELTDLISQKASKAGQAVQALSLWSKTTPQGAVKKAQNIIKEYNQTAKKKIPDLTPEQAEEITSLTDKIQQTATGTRDNEIATQLLFKYLKELVPASAGSKLRTLQNISLLLNPKTFLRNIGGNSIFAAMDTGVSKPIAAGLDSIASVFTGKKTRVNPQVGDYLQGLKQGFKEGVEDVNLGINTRDKIGSRFNLNDRTSFDNVPGLNQLEKALNYSLQVPDRMFYQAAYNESIANQMRAAGISEPTADIIRNATNEALEAVFQNNGALGNMALKMRQGANELLNINGYGLGDAFIPYAQTPANVAQQGINYSPLGLVKGIQSALGGNQRQATMDFARAITGSGLMGVGALGAYNGAFNPNIDNTRTRKNYEALGIRPNTINLGDYNVSYNQLQPLAAPVSGGAAIIDVLNGDTMQGIDRSLGSIIDLGMLQSANKFMADMNDEGLGTATTNLVASIPSRFVPTGLKQITDLTDNWQRDTYDKNPLKQGLNQAIAKVPGLNRTLPIKYDVTGQPMKKYETEGLQRIFDATTNPVFVNKNKKDETLQELINLAETQGDNSILLPVAGKRVQFKDLQGNPVVKNLNARERNEYQKQLGYLNKEVLDTITKTNLYKSLDAEDKINLISTTQRYIKGYVDEQLFDKPNAQKQKLIKSLLQTDKDKIIKEILGTTYKNEILPLQVNKIYNDNF